ncbi:MAG TPA: arylamine N-acetyltransferase [Verrucomicrobiota bacterium]|nr:hypothetical protein [Verrucomicrobiales bacterium]HRI11688.1 arylamine N-acetyltransferase [Verrucomicrobiota bacterium]
MENRTRNELEPNLRDQVLTRLGFSRAPEANLDGLRTLYDAWCHRVPFDNVRKLIHIARGNVGPLPGSTAEDFFSAWLQHGAGGTCWSGAGAICALLNSLGFPARRGIATMLVAPNLPPNHGTVVVEWDSQKHLVDSSILHGEPLLLTQTETEISHPSWGVRCTRREERWHIWWRPLHQVDGFECRVEHFDATHAEHQDRYDQTRGWSPFNYEVTARRNIAANVVGVSFGHAVSLLADGTVERHPVSPAERRQILVDKIGISEELIDQLPDDIPTPPPPGSNTARALGLGS